MKLQIIEPVVIDGVDYFGGEVVDVTDLNVAYRILNAGRAVEATEEEPKKGKAKE